MNKLNWLFSTKVSANSLNVSLLVFRVLLSLSMINTHGLKKIMDFEGTIQHIPDPIGIGSEVSAYMAVFANIVSPVFILIGLFTRPFIVPVVSTTLIGFFIVHAADPWSIKDVPFMYSLAFMLLFVLGPGKISIDGLISEKSFSP